MGEADRDGLGSGLFRQIVVWRRLGPARAVRYICFEDLSAFGFCVQSADFFTLPLDTATSRQHEAQMLELLIEEAPGRRSPLHPTLASAIKHHDAMFRDMPGL